jgi:hypothetical protein
VHWVVIAESPPNREETISTEVRKIGMVRQVVKRLTAQGSVIKSFAIKYFNMRERSRTFKLSSCC